MKYYSIGEFADKIGKTIQTLRNWDKNNTFKPAYVTTGGTRYYSQEQLNKFLGLKIKTKINKKIVGYCRVSSTKQKDDLERQIENVRTYMIAKKNLKNEEDKKQLEMMLTVSEKLREAYELKEAFYELMEKEKDKKEAIKKWIKIEVAYNLKEYNKVAETMYRWFNPIVKGFETGYTNGFTEGKNNKIKVLKRISFGVRRFDRFRKRILYLA